LSCDAWAREYVAENTKNVVKGSTLLLWASMWKEMSHNKSYRRIELQFKGNQLSTF
jgi:hypothetical protein